MSLMVMIVDGFGGSNDPMVLDSSNVVHLIHPKSEVVAEFIIVSKKSLMVLEVQLANSLEPRSLFVGQDVVQDGSVLLCSKVDPMFLALPLLFKSKDRFSPIKQVIHSVEMPGYSDICTMCLKYITNVCDTKGEIDDEDFFLVKLNEAKVMKWLNRKLGLIIPIFLKQTLSQESGSRVDSFKLSGSSTPSSLSQGNPREATRLGIQFLSAYLSEYWTTKVAENHQFTISEIYAATTASLSVLEDSTLAGVENKRSWEESNGYVKAPESLSAFTGVADEGGKISHTIKKPHAVVGKTSSSSSLQTNANKKLMKTDTRGIPSIMSFMTKKS